MNRTVTELTVLLCFCATACSGGGGDLARTLADRLSSALDFDDTTQQEGAPPPEHAGDAAFPQVTTISGPSALLPSQSFQLRITASAGSAAPGGVVLHVPLAGVHLVVPLQPLDPGTPVVLAGTLGADDTLAGSSFAIRVALLDADGNAGNYVTWAVTVREPGSGATLSLEIRERFGWKEDSVLPGATVALDRPDGSREEQTSDAEGRVSFAGIDWSDGVHLVTAHHACCQLMTAALNAAPESEDAALRLYSKSAPEGWLKVSGEAAGMLDESHILLTSSFTPGVGFHQNAGKSWSLALPPGEPVSLIALEFNGEAKPSDHGMAQTFHQWTSADHTGLSAGESIAIDFATTLAPRTAAIDFAWPTDSFSPLATGLTVLTAYANVSQRETRAEFGFPTLLDLSASGDRFEGTLEWVEPPAATEPVTSFGLAFDHGSAYVWLDGFPVAGAQDLDWLALPETTPLAGSLAEHPLHEPITWQPLDADVHPWLSIAPQTGEPIWQVGAVPGSGSLTVPEPPSTAPADLLAGGPFKGTLSFFRYEDGDDSIDAMATLRPIKLAP